MRILLQLPSFVTSDNDGEEDGCRARAGCHGGQWEAAAAEAELGPDHRQDETRRRRLGSPALSQCPIDRSEEEELQESIWGIGKSCCA